MLSAILRDEPKHLSLVTPEVPQELEEIIHHCLRKDPEHRFRCMGEVKAALESLRDNSIKRPIAETSGRRKERGEWWRKKLLWLFAGAIIALACVLGTTSGLWRRASDWLGLGFAPSPKVIAVLPFSFSGSDPSGQVYADGLAENFARKLTQIEQFGGSILVAPMADTKRQGIRDAKKARDSLGAAIVLAGAMQEAGETDSVTLTLMDAETGRDLNRITADARDAGDLGHGAAIRLAKLLLPDLPMEAARVLKMGDTKSQDACEFYFRALGHLQRTGETRELDKAIELFQLALEKDSLYAESHAGLAEAYWAKGNLTKDPGLSESARQSCDKALRIEPRLVSAWIVAGRISTGRGKWKEALESFAKALEINPASEGAGYGLARAYQGLGQLSDAEAAYLKIVRMRSAYFSAHLNLGNFYMRNARYQEAERTYLKASELAPGYDWNYSNLGAVYHYLGRYEDAEKMFKKAISLKPTAIYYTNLGTLYWHLGRYADSVPLMEKAVEMDPQEFQKWGNLADAYRLTKERAPEALKAYLKAIELAEQQLILTPDDASIRSALAGFYAGANKRAKALEEIARARRQAPTDAQVLYDAALVYEQCGQRENAISALDLALKSGYSWEEARRSAYLADVVKDSCWEKRILDRSPGKLP